MEGAAYRWYKTRRRELEKVLHLDTMLQDKASNESQK